MARKRVTMQDIADACGLSRNTVSKIFNGRGAVPERTRQKVLETAGRLGYSQLPPAARQQAAAPAEPARTIAMLTGSTPMSHNFGSYFITAFTDAISRVGSTLKLYEVSPEELALLRLPPHLRLEQTDGILCIELFDKAYLEMLSTTGIPLLSVDAYAGATADVIDYDTVSMENIASAIALTRQMLRAGGRSFGFVGDIRHCNSFYERWQGFCFALREQGLAPDPEACILAPDNEPYNDPRWVERQLRAMPRVPDAFFCANDFLALHLMTALKAMGRRLPEDVMVAGFDGSPEAGMVTPGLTTARIPSAEIGRTAAQMLLDRITRPTGPVRKVYLATTPLLRQSTRE